MKGLLHVPVYPLGSKTTIGFEVHPILLLTTRASLRAKTFVYLVKGGKKMSTPTSTSSTRPSRHISKGKLLRLSPCSRFEIRRAEISTFPSDAIVTATSPAPPTRSTEQQDLNCRNTLSQSIHRE